MNRAGADFDTVIASGKCHFGRRELFVHSAVLGTLLWILYRDIFTNLAQQWWDDPNFSHGFFIPLFSGIIVWQKRRHLANLPSRPSWYGLLIVCGALLTLFVGNLGAELFLSRSSFVLLLAGLTILFYGWRFLGAVFFAWLVLFLMIPIPAIVYNQITLPLQFLASRLATSLLTLSGVPVLREGNIIHLPALDLEVVEACSGIRSLTSLGSLTLIYGYFTERGVWKRTILALAVIPISIIANGLRIMGMGLLGQYWDPEKAEGFFHSISGWVILVLSVLMLCLFHLGIHLVSQSGAEAQRISE